MPSKDSNTLQAKTSHTPGKLFWDRQISTVWIRLGSLAGRDRGCREIACDVEEEYGQMFAAAPDTLAMLKRSAQEHLDMATLLDAWARESAEGSWSTHQVDAQRRRADQCRKYAVDCLAAIAKAEGQ